jgi:hypothetical protein
MLRTNTHDQNVPTLPTKTYPLFPHQKHHKFFSSTYKTKFSKLALSAERYATKHLIYLHLISCVSILPHTLQTRLLLSIYTPLYHDTQLLISFIHQLDAHMQSRRSLQVTRRPPSLWSYKKQWSLRCVKYNSRTTATSHFSSLINLVQTFMTWESSLLSH